MNKDTGKPTPPQLQLYDKLVQFPLFQGISSADMADIVANYKLGFRKVRTGESIVSAGQRSVMLLMIAGGSVEMKRCADNKIASHIYQKAVKSHVLVIQLFCQPLTILTTVHVTIVISPSSRLVLLPARQEYLVPVTVFPLSPLPTEQVGIRELSSLQSPRLSPHRLCLSWLRLQDLHAALMLCRVSLSYPSAPG